jgi:hypothetical protein
MDKIKDININIGQDKIRTGVIFLAGLAIGGLISGIVTRTKVKEKIEKKALNHISESQALMERSMDNACKALDKLTEKTKTLESAVRNCEHRPRMAMEG